MGSKRLISQVFPESLKAKSYTVKFNSQTPSLKLYGHGYLHLDPTNVLKVDDRLV